VRKLNLCSHCGKPFPLFIDPSAGIFTVIIFSFHWVYFQHHPIAADYSGEFTANVTGGIDDQKMKLNLQLTHQVEINHMPSHPINEF